MGNIYCKKCGINKSYYNNKKINKVNIYRRSCRIKGPYDTGHPNYLHKWNYDYEIIIFNLKNKIGMNKYSE